MTKRKLLLLILSLVFVLQGCSSGDDLSARITKEPATETDRVEESKRKELSTINKDTVVENDDLYEKYLAAVEQKHLADLAALNLPVYTPPTEGDVGVKENCRDIDTPYWQDPVQYKLCLRAVVGDTSGATALTWKANKWSSGFDRMLVRVFKTDSQDKIISQSYITNDGEPAFPAHFYHSSKQLQDGTFLIWGSEGGHNRNPENLLNMEIGECLLVSIHQYKANVPNPVMGAGFAYEKICKPINTTPPIDPRIEE